MQHRLHGITTLLHREQRKLLWAALKRVLEAEATEAEGEAAHALIQKLEVIFCQACDRFLPTVPE